MKARAILITLFIAFPVSITSAQRRFLGCKSPIEYGNRNQVEPKRSSVRDIYGRAIVEVGQPGKEVGPVQACLGLFTERSHRLVASVVADEDGRFKFSSVPSGRYRLVVRDPQDLLCVANMPLHIVRWPRGKVKPIVIHMRPSGIDDCSYGDFK